MKSEETLQLHDKSSVARLILPKNFFSSEESFLTDKQTRNTEVDPWPSLSFGILLEGKTKYWCTCNIIATAMPKIKHLNRIVVLASAYF